MPNMSDSTADYNSYNIAFNKAMQNYQQMQKMKYYPRQMEADIMGKTLGPLAALATSTQGQIFAGDQGEQARQTLSYILSQYGQGQQQHQSLLGQMYHKIMGGESQGGMGGAQQQGGYPNDIADTAKQRYGQKATGETVGAGQVYGVPGNQRIAPTEDIRSQTASAVVGGKRTNDIISGLLNEINKVKTGKGAGNALTKGALGLEGTNFPYISDIAGAIVPKELKVKQGELEDSLVNNHRYSREKAHSKVQKGVNESLEKYEKRISQLQQELAKQGKNLKKSTREGISLEEGNQGLEEKTSAPIKGSIMPMWKNGVKHYIPADKVYDAETNWGYTRAK